MGSKAGAPCFTCIVVSGCAILQNVVVLACMRSKHWKLNNLFRISRYFAPSDGGL